MKRTQRDKRFSIEGGKANVSLTSLIPTLQSLKVGDRVVLTCHAFVPKAKQQPEPKAKASKPQAKPKAKPQGKAKK